MAQIAKIAIEAATFAIDKPYDYLVPDGMEVRAGMRVIVPFGRGNRRSEGMVLAVEPGLQDRPLKAVEALLDETPQLSREQIRLGLWMCQRYFCTFYDALHAILPIGLWYQHREIWTLQREPEEEALSDKERVLLDMLREKEQTFSNLQAAQPRARELLQKMERLGLVACRRESSRRTCDKTDSLVSLAIAPDEAAELIREKKRAPRQAAALSFLLQNGETSLHELLYFTGVSRQAVTQMEKAEILSLREQEVFRVQLRPSDKQVPEIRLNEEQQATYEEILRHIHGGRPGVTLLQGVTGSGKTEVYICLARRLLEEGKRAMILVPEIALTPQMMQRFSMYFGEDVALLHSALGIAERYDQYKRIRQGLVKIVLGTRSAVFAPLPELGMIVIDEEQENSYESEKPPCYHARDIAKYRCAKEGAWLVLGSATPTVETAYLAREGDYHLSLLRKRYNENALPQVSLVDMRQELKQGNYTSISRRLYEEIQKNLELGQQTILFLNRRGNSRALVCVDCGSAPECPRCSARLTYHSANERLMCHYCGYSEPFTEICPECGSHDVRYSGTGTQKIEDELATLFPEARILRMDADSTMGRYSHENKLKDFADGKYDILLGTQMVAKGLDFDNVGLVGIISADSSLNIPDFRAPERTFQLITQAAGRAGRGDLRGRVIIQTYSPDNYAIKAAAEHDYEGFCREELRLRKLMSYPPYYDLIRLIFSGDDEKQVAKEAGGWYESLNEMIHTGFIYRPQPAPVNKIKETYRYHMMIKCPRGRRGLFLGALDKLNRENNSGKTRVNVGIDINPYSFI